MYLFLSFDGMDLHFLSTTILVDVLDVALEAE